MNGDRARLNRSKAVADGVKRFFGLACVADIQHCENSGSWRYTSSGRCCACEKERVQKFRKAQSRNS